MLFSGNSEEPGEDRSLKAKLVRKAGNFFAPGSARGARKKEVVENDVDPDAILDGNVVAVRRGGSGGIIELNDSDLGNDLETDTPDIPQLPDVRCLKFSFAT